MLTQGFYQGHKELDTFLLFSAPRTHSLLYCVLKFLMLIYKAVNDSDCDYILSFSSPQSNVKTWNAPVIRLSSVPIQEDNVPLKIFNMSPL